MLERHLVNLTPWLRYHLPGLPSRIPQDWITCLCFSLPCLLVLFQEFVVVHFPLH